MRSYKSVQDYSMELDSKELHSAELFSTELHSDSNPHSRNTLILYGKLKTAFKSL